MHLSKNYLGSGRNITMDNWFTSYRLADTLLAKQTTIVGTLRSNRREIPPQAKKIEGRHKGDSVHFYNNDKTLCSFWDKKNVPVLLLSSMHKNGVHLANDKPEIVSFYNLTKSGVDNLDKLVRTYKSQRKCRRWPYGVYMTLLDEAIIASLKTMEIEQQTSLSHYKFKLELGIELALPLVIKRTKQTRLSSAIKNAMSAVGVEFPQENTTSNGIQRKQRCSFCPIGKDRKTNLKCYNCNKSLCLEHCERRCICPECKD